MANEVKVPGLTAALEAIGNAHAYKGSFVAANSVVAMGQKEGPIEVGGNEPELNRLTAPEITGPMVHDAVVMGEDAVFTIPLIVPADGSFWAANSLTGVAGGGYSSPQRPAFTSVAIIPDYEVGGGLKYDGTTWTRLAGNGVGAASGAGAAPKNAIWLWRASISRARPRYDMANGGKMIVPVTVQGYYRAESTVGNPMPEGHHLYSIGDPAALGVLGFEFSATT